MPSRGLSVSMPIGFASPFSSGFSGNLIMFDHPEHPPQNPLSDPLARFLAFCVVVRRVLAAPHAQGGDSEVDNDVEASDSDGVDADNEVLNEVHPQLQAERQKLEAERQKLEAERRFVLIGVTLCLGIPLGLAAAVMAIRDRTYIEFAMSGVERATAYLREYVNCHYINPTPATVESPSLLSRVWAFRHFVEELTHRGFHLLPYILVSRMQEERILFVMRLFIDFAVISSPFFLVLYLLLHLFGSD